jgi:hypothetical protein
MTLHQDQFDASSFWLPPKVQEKGAAAERAAPSAILADFQELCDALFVLLLMPVMTMRCIHCQASHILVLIVKVGQLFPMRQRHQVLVAILTTSALSQ